MKKYQVNFFYSLQVKAENEEQAEKKAAEYIKSEYGEGVRLSDMSFDIEEAEYICGNCGRSHTNEIVAGISRCNRCKDL